MGLQMELPNLTDTQKTYDAMRNNLLTVNTALNLVQEDVKEIQGDIKKLKEVVIVGNGELSHGERIRRMEDYMEVIKDNIRYWGRLIGGALLLNFLGFMSGIIIAVVKFLPVLEHLARNP